MAITVEYHRPGGANPGDVRSTALRSVPLKHLSLTTDSEPRLWSPGTVAELFGRCGVGSRRERVEIGLLKEKQN